MTRASYEQPAGDTLSLAGFVLLPAGVWTARAALNGPNGKVADLAVTLEPLDVPTATETHALSLFLSAVACGQITPALLTTDVRFEDADGNVKHSPPYTILLFKPQTP